MSYYVQNENDRGVCEPRSNVIRTLDPEQIKRVARYGEFMFLIDYTGYIRDSNGGWITDSQLCGPSGVPKIDKAIMIQSQGHIVKIDLGINYGSWQPMSVSDL